jgi:hypothetical protein
VRRSNVSKEYNFDNFPWQTSKHLIKDNYANIDKVLHNWAVKDFGRKSPLSIVLAKANQIELSKDVDATKLTGSSGNDCKKTPAKKSLPAKHCRSSEEKLGKKKVVQKRNRFIL